MLIKLTPDKKDIIPRISRWFRELEIYEKTSENRAGEKMKHVDPLSRINSAMIIEKNNFEAKPFLTYHIDHFGPIDKRYSPKQHALLISDKIISN